jgi:hypothetical protein
MTRGLEERTRDVRRWLDAALRVHAERASLVPALVSATGLSPEGVELGFASLERGATPEELAGLVAAAGDAEHVHVVLSANVFVAPLRAIALARAAAPRVTVRASPRDPVLATALVAAAGDPAVTLTSERDPASTPADRIDVYGRAETLAAVREAARPGVVVREHGPGLGVAYVAAGADRDACAEALAADVVPFDQRGCLSPRVALVEGTAAEAEAFARALHDRLVAWEARVPRGELAEAEHAAAGRWRDALAFAGGVFAGGAASVAFVEGEASALPVLAVPPPGRNVLVVAVRSRADARAALAPIAPFVVALGCSAGGSEAREVAPPHARVSPLGGMQRPPLDGPVDRRGVEVRAAFSPPHMR